MSGPEQQPTPLTSCGACGHVLDEWHEQVCLAWMHRNDWMWQAPLLAALLVVAAVGKFVGWW